MKHLNLILIILILSCCPLHPVYAFLDKDIRLLTMKDGLADNTIPCIYKDEDGFMWFGTDNGLSRYDGKTIQNFKPANTYVSIAAIVRLSDDFLGIVSDGYLYYFNRKQETFFPIHTESDTAIGVFNVLPADDSSFWGISGNRLILCQWEIQQGKEEEKTAVRVRIQKTFQLLEEKGEVFSSLCYHEKAGNGMWLTTNRGNLILFHPDTPEAYQKIPLTDGKPLQVTSILNRDGVVWISTIAKGIVRYHTKSGNMDRISYGGTGKENLLSHTDVYQTIFIGNNRYLAVTWGGYTLLMPDEKQPEELTSEIYNNTHTQIYRNLETRMISACYDPNGLLWIGTNGGGVMYSDLRSQFYDRYYHSNNCSIYLSGKVTGDCIHRIESLFGCEAFGTDFRKPEKTEFHPVTTSGKRIFIERPDALQSAVRMGMLSLDRNHPDYLKARVLVTLFGGYFGSRLMSNIREDKGYTYGISAAIMPYPGQGVLAVSAEAANEFVEPLIGEVYHEIDRLQNELASDGELSMVKNYMLGDMCRSYESAFSLADAWIFVQVSGLQDTYFAEALDAVKEVTPQEIRELAGRHLCKEKLKEIVCGKKMS